jgi:uncharacterized protein
MKIRSITYFLNPKIPLQERQLRKAADFLAAARPAFESAGYEVQTARLATTPFPGWLPWQEPVAAAQMVQELESTSRSLGYDYLSLGPAQPDQLQCYVAIPKLLSLTQDVFFSGSMTLAGGISLPAVRQCADVVRRAAQLSPDGFANLRFAALANVPPGSPFFPAAYHRGRAPAFSLATQAADLAVQAFTNAASLEEARGRLTTAIQEHGRVLAEVARRLVLENGTRFGGIDFSLAPFPQEDLSLGTALERLGISAIGLHGSLAVFAFLADTIDQARFPHTGFSGLLLPVLEDATLARRAAEGTLTVKDMLLFSAVCGTGLDTLPLPGDVSGAQLAALLLDVAGLALRLDKPLTARLMPIPGKVAGDPTSFEFAYFANSRVLALDAQALEGSLAGDEVVTLHRRGR